MRMKDILKKENGKIGTEKLTEELHISKIELEAYKESIRKLSKQ